jgi:hypothetical protein
MKLKEVLENPGHGHGSHRAARVFRRQKRRNHGFPELPEQSASEQ